MASQNLTTANPLKTFPTSRISRWVMVAGLALLALLAVLAVLLTTRWPFTPQAVMQALQEQSQSRVLIADFRRLYFPHPGAVADGITFRRDPNPSAPPLMTIRRLTIQTSYLGLLSHHIRHITAEGLNLRIPAPDEADTTPTGLSQVKLGATTAGLVVDQITANGAQVEIAASADRPTPLVFTARTLLLDHVTDNRPLDFHATVKNPAPPGEISIAGKFGPWKTGEGNQTPLSGSYTFSHANLGVFTGTAGILSAQGKFGGILDHITTEGTVTVPDFATDYTNYPMPLSAQYHALVNGTNGDVALQPFQAKLATTSIVGSGKIEGDSKHKGKTVTLQFASAHGHVQDLLRLFLKGEPPMTGAVTFRAGVTLPPTDAPFVKRVELNGDFGIAGAQYTNPDTQRRVDLASAKSQGEADKIEDDQDADKKHGTDKTDQDLEHVVSNVKGHVVLQNGVATFSHLSFDVPGASAKLNGTYSLLNETIDMHGVVLVNVELSQATTGVKSFLMKIVQPVIRKKRRTGTGSVVALRVTGTYRNPSFLVTPLTGK